MAPAAAPSAAPTAMEPAARKQEMRQRMAAYRREHPHNDAAAEALAQIVVGMREFRSATRVALYAALPDEISTAAIHRAAGAAKKRVALPRSLTGGVLAFAWVESWEDLRPGRYGVLEPAEGSEMVSLADLDLIIVPGVAFDRSGRRLGRGAGCYDRVLASRTGDHPFVLGVAEAAQIVEEVPTEEFDQRVDAVATECELHPRETHHP